MKPALELLQRYLSRHSSLFVAMASAMGLGLVAFLDFATGSEVSLSLFYLAPISVVAWRIGPTSGAIAALAGSATWFIVDRAGNHIYTHPLIPLWNAMVRLGFFLIVGGLLVKLRGALNREQAMARTDGLTGLLNRRALEEMATREVERAQRSGLPITFAYLDLDGFKSINDRMGHAVGDEVLRSVGRVMGSVMRTIDLTARIGGDEFALVMPETSTADARIAIERLSDGLRTNAVACSIGVVVFEDPPRDVTEALDAVDAIMYQVKSDPSRRVEIQVVARPAAEAAAS